MQRQLSLGNFAEGSQQYLELSLALALVKAPVLVSRWHTARADDVVLHLRRPSPWKASANHAQLESQQEQRTLDYKGSSPLLTPVWRMTGLKAVRRRGMVMAMKSAIRVYCCLGKMRSH
jgi:hypothetical protein